MYFHFKISRMIYWRILFFFSTISINILPKDCIIHLWSQISHSSRYSFNLLMPYFVSLSQLIANFECTKHSPDNNFHHQITWTSTGGRELVFFFVLFVDWGKALIDRQRQRQHRQRQLQYPLWQANSTQAKTTNPSSSPERPKIKMRL